VEPVEPVEAVSCPCVPVSPCVPVCWRMAQGERGSQRCRRRSCGVFSCSVANGAFTLFIISGCARAHELL
jgi:hypothetical protein